MYETYQNSDHKNSIKQFSRSCLGTDKSRNFAAVSFSLHSIPHAMDNLRYSASGLLQRAFHANPVLKKHMTLPSDTPFSDENI